MDWEVEFNGGRQAGRQAEKEVRNGEYATVNSC